MPNQQLADEPHTPIIRSVYSLFRDNICGVDLADMQLISKCNKEIRFLLCVFDIFTKYAWLIPLKVKEGVAIVNAFQRMSDDLKRKSYKIWVDKGSEFYNWSMESWQQKNDIEIKEKLRKICFCRKTYRNFKE